FEFRQAKWEHVIDWLTKESGLHFSSSDIPTGTVNFSAANKDKRYTLGEIIDILNNQLVTQNYIIIRREQSFMVISAEKQIDPSIVPRITTKELAERGDTEIAQVVMPLTALVAEELNPEVKEMLSPFGKSVALGKFNQLLVQDTCKNLKRIWELIQAGESRLE